MSIITKSSYSKLCNNLIYRRDFYNKNIQRSKILIEKFKKRQPGRLLPSLILDICETDLRLETVIDVDSKYNPIKDERMGRNWGPFMEWDFYIKFRENTQPIDIGEMEEIIESYTELPQLLHKIYKRLKLDYTLEQITIKKINYADEKILYLEKELEGKDNILRVTTNKLLMLRTLRKKPVFKLADYTDDEIEKMADACKFKNGYLNLSKLGRELSVDPDTAKNEIIRRKLSYLLK